MKQRSEGYELDVKVLKRFLRFVKVDKGGCWIWTGAKHRYGHGHFYLNGKKRRAHVVSYEWFVGKVPNGKVLDHFKCDNPSCVNYKHVRPVTHRENILRGVGVAALNASKKSCVNGHLFTVENTKIRSDGNRDCRTCIRERAVRYRKKAA